MNSVKYLVCPMCGKTSPLYNGKTTLKRLDEVHYLALIKTRTSMGRKGFKNVGEQMALCDCLSDPVCARLANELLDLCSGIIVHSWENDVAGKYGLHKPLAIKKLEKLESVQVVSTQEEDGMRLTLDDNMRAIKKCENEKKELQRMCDGQSFRLDDQDREIKKLKKLLKERTESDDSVRLKSDDDARKIASLKMEVEGLKSIVKMYEERSLQ